VSPVGRNNRQSGRRGPEGQDGQGSLRRGNARPKDEGGAPATTGAAGAVTLTNRYGLHMRPAQAVVELANSFLCDIDLVANGRAVDAKSILALIGLEAACGDEVLIEARGEGADEAVARLGDLLASLPEFDEAAGRQMKCAAPPGQEQAGPRGRAPAGPQKAGRRAKAGPSDTAAGRKRNGTSGRSGPGDLGKRRPGRPGDPSGAGRSASVP
jgi:phosphocarrier protein HPr